MSYLTKLLKPPRGQVAWVSRHMKAVGMPTNSEGPLISMLRGWLNYADRHYLAYESTIGEDGVLGPEWAKIGASLRELLNGELGRLDGGTLDGVLYDTLKAEGFDPDQM